MKWYEYSDDLGDGTSVQRRFRTREEAEAVREKEEQSGYFQCDGDGSPVCEVDTDSPGFFTTLKDFD